MDKLNGRERERYHSLPKLMPFLLNVIDGTLVIIGEVYVSKVFDVLESQGRIALLPDAVISGILGQLTVTVTYEPMKCQEAILNLANDS
ncbi:hypothetical protein KIN20_030827 [Parelaphostrongylus tenuis]|uniref:Uncharacterized protein n=1 Tax=Parelaphostrongylus tenuis TaxID=148309 RepID=A0AAD5R4B7_PARTN|nr:hypothetical protein KIN20_030827 [Parelaphostrongylus tenuis]